MHAGPQNGPFLTLYTPCKGIIVPLYAHLCPFLPIFTLIFTIFLRIFTMWDGRLNIETIEPPPLFEPPPHQ